MLKASDILDFKKWGNSHHMAYRTLRPWREVNLGFTSHQSLNHKNRHTSIS